MGKLALPRVSFIVTALNEEPCIEDTINEICRALDGTVSQYEIVCVNDGSTDQTGPIMDRLAKQNPNIRVFHNEKNLNLGGAFKRGLKEARLDYVMWLPGDNAAPEQTVRTILSKVGQADIVVPYLVYATNRTWIRRVISRSYTMILNLLFGLKLRYYNGLVVHRRDLIQGIDITTNSFACFAEALIKLLKSGATFVPVDFHSTQKHARPTSAFRIKNVVNVIKTIFYLYWVCVLRNPKRRRPTAKPLLAPIADKVNAEQV